VIARAHNERSGFTLIEMMISAALMTIVIGSAYMCLSAGLSGKKLIEARTEGVQSARVALSMMAADVRAAVPMPGKVEFMGMRRTVGPMDADNLDFSTHNYNPKRAREPDYCEISYFLTRDPESDSFILTRRRDSTPDPEPLDGGVREEIARGVRGLRLEYYDGIEWFDDWGDPEGKTKGMTYPPSNSYGLPEAVRITIIFDPETTRRATKENERAAGVEEKAPMTFQTIARLDLAAFFNRQAKSKSSGGNNAAPQNDSAPEGAPQ
jgi:general secretion pathway protein J